MESPKPRKQTPRVPSNFLFNRLVPLAIGVMVVLLLVVIVVVLLPLFGVDASYSLVF